MLVPPCLGFHCTKVFLKKGGGSLFSYSQSKTKKPNGLLKAAGYDDAGNPAISLNWTMRHACIFAFSFSQDSKITFSIGIEHSLPTS